MRQPTSERPFNPDMRVLQFRRRHPELVMPVHHLSASDVAAYLDRSLTDAARERTEAHLSDCPLCRDELVACAQIATSAPSRHRKLFLVPLLAAAAPPAAVIIAVAVETPRGSRAGLPTTERSSGPVGPGLAIVAPRDGGSVASAAVRFTWRADSGALAYRVVITTASGTPVWSGEASDTTIAPPREVTFVDGGDFYWRVESSRADGGGARSQTATFRVLGR
jgi:hypothetical protein